MVICALVCPHPPLLLRELGGAHDGVPELRAACSTGLARVLAAQPDVVGVVGGDDLTRPWPAAGAGGVRRFGTSTGPDADPLPLSLAVGRRLLDDAGWTGPVELHGVAWEAGPATAEEVAAGIRERSGRTALLVMADGSARRGPRAPGHLDERAFDLDDRIGAALAEGDGAALTRLDGSLAHELMAQGRAALAVLGQVTGDTRPAEAEVLHRSDPYGVMYTVSWWGGLGSR